MRVRLGLMGLALAAVAAVSPVQAEPTGSYIYVIPFAGYTVFDGDLKVPANGQGYVLGGPGNPLVDDFHLGGRLGWQWRPYLGLEGAAGFTPSSVDTVGGADVDFFHASGNLVLTPFAGSRGGPFASLGYGMSQLKPSSGGEAVKQGNLEAALGLNLWFTDQIGMRLEARDLMWLPSEEPTKIATQTWILGGALTVAFGGKARDTDLDGVADRKDKCPDTPRGATVDETGCPKDSDGDSVLDGLDACPATPTGATIDARGCPSDADADSVLDGLDQCPDTPRGATVDARGCPSDADRDTVFDGIDQCPATPPGCVVDEKGCPRDSDGDSVCNGLDQCPGTATGLRVDVNGCPIEVIEKETELLDTGMIRLQEINFETSKADLLPESLPRLDVVGQVLLKWPELKIEIGGHTDDRGSAKFNQQLSEARAKSVSAYLVRQFNLQPSQFTAKGYGESKALVPNNNALNMAKNRRVEFVVQNKDVLKREVEKRRLLEKQPVTPPVTPAPADTTKR